MKSALLIHAYYISELKRIFDFQFCSSFEFFYITTNYDNYDLVSDMCIDYGLANKCKIIVSHNDGYDLLPFFKICSQIDYDDVDLICKIHTKKGSANLESHYKNIQPVWANALYTSMLTDVNPVKGYFEENNDVAVLFPASLYKSSKSLGYGNEHLVTELLESIGYDGDPAREVGFVAGTMFWARTEVLKPLLELDLDAISNKETSNISESGQYASHWHAIERLFGYLPIMSGGKIALSFANDLEHSTFDIVSIDENGNNPYINRSGVGIGLVSELFIKENYELLKNNIDESDIIGSPSNIMGIDPIIYYLRYGVFLGEELVPWFNSAAYWHDYPESINKRYNPLVHFLLNQSGKLILPATYNINESIRLIKQVGLFDASFYLRENPDVANSGISPIRHFCTHGWKEWRDPSPKFELLKYYQDVFKQKDMNVNPLVHYAIWKGKVTLLGRFKRLIPVRIKIILTKLLKLIS